MTTTALELAVTTGDIDALREEHDADELCNYEGSLVRLALEHQQLDVVAYLVELAERERDDFVCDGWSRQHLAAARGALDVLQAADVTDLRARTQIGETMIHAAAWGGQVQVIDWLLAERVVALNTRTAVGELALDCAAHGQRWDAFEHLAEAGLGKNQDLASQWPDSAIHLAVQYDQVDLVKRLVARGCDPGGLGHNRRSALHVACERGNAAMFDLLVGLGVDPKHVDNAGETVLHSAATGGNVEVLERLQTADVQATDSRGKTALHTAAQAGQYEAFAFLLTLGANPALEDIQKRTVMHYAAQGGHPAIIQELVRLGADPTSPGPSARTTLHMAATNGHVHAVKLFHSLGVDIDAQDSHGLTALHMVADGFADQAVDTTRVLLQLGADRLLRTGEGVTARNIAQYDETGAITELLDTYYPITPPLVALLLGLRGPTSSPLTRFASHSTFDVNVLTLIKPFVSGPHEPVDG